MIELNGHVSQIFRSNEKSPGFEARKNGASKVSHSNGSSAAKPSQTFRAEFTAPSVINFEYVPSGRLNLNQDERQRLIDFFE